MGDSIPSIHVFVTDEQPYGYSMTSPQLPELVFGRATESELRRDYRDAIAWAGFKAGRVEGHYQMRGMTPQGVEYVIRWSTDGDGGEQEVRREVANMMHNILQSADHAPDALDTLVPAQTGEFVFVACMADDTIGWLTDQLEPTGDALTAMLNVAGMMVGSTQLARDPELDWPSIDELGWTRETTVGDIISAANQTAPQMALV